jgi:nitroimidazol reductase NimA-like FMN-containing flavoprotein (pyridoxamine 5'-phosphate oxidase superfamily)
MTSRGLQRLSEDECHARLASTHLGRIGLRIGESPAILPVNYAMLGSDVVFRTDPGSKLSAALMGLQVAFEIDGDSGEGDGEWSVLVVGYAEEIRDTATLARVDALGLEPWVEGHRDNVVRISTKRITGRRIVH